MLGNDGHGQGGAGHTRIGRAGESPYQLDGIGQLRRRAQPHFLHRGPPLLFDQCDRLTAQLQAGKLVFDHRGELPGPAFQVEQEVISPDHREGRGDRVLVQQHTHGMAEVVQLRAGRRRQLECARICRVGELLRPGYEVLDLQEPVEQKCLVPRVGRVASPGLRPRETGRVCKRQMSRRRAKQLPGKRLVERQGRAGNEVGQVARPPATGQQPLHETHLQLELRQERALPDCKTQHCKPGSFVPPCAIYKRHPRKELQRLREVGPLGARAPAEVQDLRLPGLWQACIGRVAFGRHQVVKQPPVMPLGCPTFDQLEDDIGLERGERFIALVRSLPGPAPAQGHVQSQMALVMQGIPRRAGRGKLEEQGIGLDRGGRVQRESTRDGRLLRSSEGERERIERHGPGHVKQGEVDRGIADHQGVLVRRQRELGPR